MISTTSASSWIRHFCLRGSRNRRCRNLTGTILLPSYYLLSRLCPSPVAPRPSPLAPRPSPLAPRPSPLFTERLSLTKVIRLHCYRLCCPGPVHFPGVGTTRGTMHRNSAIPQNADTRRGSLRPGV